DPGEAMVKIIAETRQVEYINRVKRYDEGGDFAKSVIVRSQGMEIVREVHSCRKCIDNAPMPEGWFVPGEVQYANSLDNVRGVRPVPVHSDGLGLEEAESWE